jgi:hypothetical protein
MCVYVVYYLIIKYALNVYAKTSEAPYNCKQLSHVYCVIINSLRLMGSVFLCHCKELEAGIEVDLYMQMKYS